MKAKNGSLILGPICYNKGSIGLTPTIFEEEKAVILHSLQAWQLGETSDGQHLLRASAIYAKKIEDADYLAAIARRRLLSLLVFIVRF